MKHVPLKGLIAAVLTPLDARGDLNLSEIGRFAESLISSGVDGFYCCGSTGEGVSLTTDERKEVAQAWVSAAGGRVPVVIQVGHNSAREAAELARHASTIGANAISATCPSYFKIDSMDGLVECMGQIAAAAANLPFYYYHIPSLTGNRLSMPEFLSVGGKVISNLVGMKYTSTELFEFQQSLSFENGKYEVVWGVDEMLLGAWATGTKCAIGSTYNVAAPLYKRLIAAVERSDLSEARRLQLQSIELINVLKRFPFFSALKHVLNRQGFRLGGCRTPNGCLSNQQIVDLDRLLDSPSIQMALSKSNS